MGKQRRKPRVFKGTVDAKSPLDQRVARGMAHPLRAEILAYLTAHPVSSPAEMKKAGVGEKERADVSHLSYHTRVLEGLALVEEVESAPKRGAIEHFYRAISRMFLDVEAWRELPKEMKTAISVKAVEESLDSVSEAISMGTFDSRDERAVINLGLLLDEAGFNAASEKLVEVMSWLQEQQAAALQRVSEGKGEVINTSVSLLMYESPPKARLGEAPER
jgi:DNA-binding transcriptional ArsR family regulator